MTYQTMLFRTVEPDALNPTSLPVVETLHSVQGKGAWTRVNGGLDSSTADAIAIADGYEVTALSLRSCSRHERALQAVLEVTRQLVGVNSSATWSYKQGEEPWGLCDSCPIRDKALIEGVDLRSATTARQKLYSRETAWLRPRS